MLDKLSFIFQPAVFSATTHSYVRKGSRSISSASLSKGSAKISTGQQSAPAWTPLRPALVQVEGRSQSSPLHSRHEEHQGSHYAAAGFCTYQLTRWGKPFLYVCFTWIRLVLIWWIRAEGPLKIFLHPLPSVGFRVTSFLYQWSRLKKFATFTLRKYFC